MSHHYSGDHPQSHVELLTPSKLRCVTCVCSIDPVNVTMIWAWQVFRMINTGHPAWSPRPHHSGVVTGMVKLGLLITSLSAPVSCYARRPETVTTSFQRGFPLWITSRPPPPTIANLRTVAKVCNFLVAGVNWHLSPGNVGGLCDAPLLSLFTPTAAVQSSAVRLRAGGMPAEDRRPGGESSDQSSVSADQRVSSADTLPVCSPCSHTVAHYVQ